MSKCDYCRSCRFCKTGKGLSGKTYTCTAGMVAKQVDGKSHCDAYKEKRYGWR